jgi:copper(I)-binding protein
MRTSTLPGAIVGLVAALGLALVGCGPQPLSVQNHPVPPTADIEDAWIQVPRPSATATEVFMTITGPAVDVVVVRVTSPSASRVTLHETLVGPSGDTERRLVPEIPIPATSTVHVGTEGYAVVLEGLRTTLVAGQTVELIVVFDNGVSATLQAEVRH